MFTKYLFECYYFYNVTNVMGHDFRWSYRTMPEVPKWSQRGGILCATLCYWWLGWNLWHGWKHVIVCIQAISQFNIVTLTIFHVALKISTKYNEYRLKKRKAELRGQYHFSFTFMFNTN